ncbi:MAG: family 78 glycoside hydrolase catalytic domain [Acidobacteriaceae bacterium]|nr:family 78 glycoside hydrolase catalytic domain [Acidobacteriaceae bacterium]
MIAALIFVACPAVGFAAPPIASARIISPATPFASDAHWIVAPATTSAASAPTVASAPLPIFRRSFTVRGKITSATLYISGLGQFEAHLNGKNVTQALLTPGWSDYRKRVYYDSYDVTRLVIPGENALGVMLGNGMYNVFSPENRYTKFRRSFGQPKLIASLVLRYSDGTQQRIVSDGAWKTTPGPISYANIYGGEDYDARQEQPGWDAPRFDDKGWTAASEVDGPGGELQPETIPPVVANESYAPVAVTHPKPGITVYDLGQNMAGWPEIEAQGTRGDSIRLLPGELVDATGLVTQRSGGASAKNPDYSTYTLRGGGVETWHPRFSYTGFRYVQVEFNGPAAEIAPPVIRRFAGRFLHDDFAVDGQFNSSSDLLNRIHTLIDRAILSNSYSVLTDCPTREKLGWLEQTHLAGASIMYNYNVASLYAKQAADMRDAQTPDGLVPDIAPEYTVFHGGFRDSPEWGAAAILSPWQAYQFYGDLDLLRDQYPAMQRYAAYLRSKAQDHILAYGLGDWYDIGPKNPGLSQLTSPGVTATAIYYQSLTTLAGVASQLKHFDEANNDGIEAEQVKDAFNKRFFHAETNQYDTGSQTANAMALALQIVPGDHYAEVLDNLVADIHAHGDHVTAGDVGFHYVVRALTDGGRSDVLYAMLMRTDKPSYGDQLAHGATTLTEAWDTNPTSSQNHFMLGHAEEWFYRGLAGIRFDLEYSNRSEQVIVQPAVVGDLTHVSASYNSKLGRIASAWSRAGDKLTMEVTLPVTGRIVIPEAFSKDILLDGKPVASTKAVRVPRASSFDGKISYSENPTYQLPTGTYHIESHR